jgi:hypothetical protein
MGKQKALAGNVGWTVHMFIIGRAYLFRLPIRTAAIMLNRLFKGERCGEIE